MGSPGKATHPGNNWEAIGTGMPSREVRDGAGTGRMGVLGPMRMDYRRTIRVIEEVSEALGESLET